MLRGLILRHIVFVVSDTGEGRLGLGQEENRIGDCIRACDINN